MHPSKQSGLVNSMQGRSGCLYDSVRACEARGVARHVGICTTSTSLCTSPCSHLLHHASMTSMASMYTRDQYAQQHTHRHRLVCNAGSNTAVAFDLPQSLDQAVDQAVEALVMQLSPKQRNKKRKGMKPVIRRTLSVEIPIADDSPAAQVELGFKVALPLARLDDEVIIVFADQAAADTASSSTTHSKGNMQSQCDTCWLGDAYDVELEGTLVIVGATVGQLEQVSTLIEGWRGTGAVLVNPQWAPLGDSAAVPDAYASFVNAFDMVYCFMPLAIQGFLNTTEGAVFRWVQQPDIPSSQVPWAILRNTKGTWTQIGRQARRPQQEELELALYNAVAAESVLAQGAKMFRGFGKKGGK